MPKSYKGLPGHRGAPKAGHQGSVCPIVETLADSSSALTIPQPRPRMVPSYSVYVPLGDSDPIQWHRRTTRSIFPSQFEDPDLVTLREPQGELKLTESGLRVAAERHSAHVSSDPRIQSIRIPVLERFRSGGERALQDSLSRPAECRPQPLRSTLGQAPRRIPFAR